MAYASQADVEAILPDGEDVPEEAEERLAVNLEEATDLVVGHLGREWTGEPGDDGVPSDVPDPVRRVTARVALRGFMDTPDNPGASAEVNLMGPFSHALNWSKEAQARAFYLTDSDEVVLERFMEGSGAGRVSYAPMSGAGGTWYA